jgi:transposase
MQLTLHERDTARKTCKLNKHGSFCPSDDPKVELYVNGTVRQADLARAFQIQPLALKRWVKRYRAQGARAFFQSRKGGSKPKVLTADVRQRVQSRLDQGQTLSEISAELALNYDVLRKAIADGRLKSR